MNRPSGNVGGVKRKRCSGDEVPAAKKKKAGSAVWGVKKSGVEGGAPPKRKACVRAGGTRRSKRIVGESAECGGKI